MLPARKTLASCGDRLLTDKLKPVLLESLFNKNKLVSHIASDLVREVCSPDGSTRLYKYTDKCKREGKWDSVTLACNGLVVRDGVVIARPPRVALDLDTPLYPETHKEWLPDAEAEITDFLDGDLVVAYENTNGTVVLCARDSFIGSVAGQATSAYRHLEGRNRMDWPDGHTPVFVLVGGSKRLMSYRWDGLALVALVNNETGAEYRYGAMCEWARHNDMRVVESVSMTRQQALSAHVAGRGLMLKWDIGDVSPPMRIKLTSELYASKSRMVEAITPHRLWKLQRAGAEISNLQDGKIYPPGFAAWVQGWLKRIEERRQQVQEEALTIFCKLPDSTKPPVREREARKACVELFAREVGQRAYLYPVLYAMLDNNDEEQYVWSAAERETLGQPGWRK